MFECSSTGSAVKFMQLKTTRVRWLLTQLHF